MSSYRVEAGAHAGSTVVKFNIASIPDFAAAKFFKLESRFQNFQLLPFVQDQLSCQTKWPVTIYQYHYFQPANSTMHWIVSE